MMYTSLLLALAASSLANPILSTRQQPRTKLPEIYPTLFRYGEFAAASIPASCPIPPDGSTVLEYINIASTDTQATIFRADNTKQIIVSFAGSASLRDALTDLTFLPVSYSGCSGAKAHLGFYAAWKSITDSVKQGITKALAANSGYSTVLVGHSLGGALTSLAYAELKSQSQYKITEAWSYGEPRVGNQQYSNCIDALSGASDSNIGTYHRITHGNDGVPLIPPTYFGFQHSGTEIWVNDDANGQTSADTTFRCYGQEPTDCVNAQGGIGINQDHVNYPGINYATACGSGAGL